MTHNELLSSNFNNFTLEHRSRRPSARKGRGRWRHCRGRQPSLLRWCTLALVFDSRSKALLLLLQLLCVLLRLLRLLLLRLLRLLRLHLLLCWMRLLQLLLLRQLRLDLRHLLDLLQLAGRRNSLQLCC